MNSGLSEQKCSRDEWQTHVSSDINTEVCGTVSAQLWASLSQRTEMCWCSSVFRDLTHTIAVSVTVALQPCLSLMGCWSSSVETRPRSAFLLRLILSRTTLSSRVYCTCDGAISMFYKLSHHNIFQSTRGEIGLKDGRRNFPNTSEITQFYHGHETKQGMSLTTKLSSLNWRE